MYEGEWYRVIKEDHDVSVRSSSNGSIFKIPDFLKDRKKEAYVPQVVSLGPYHCISAKLSAMEYYKRRALLNMMTRFNDQNNFDKDNLTFATNAKEAILNRFHDIRGCYKEFDEVMHGEIMREMFSHFSYEPFFSIMLSVDGCFILEVLKTLDKRGFQPGKIYAPTFGENIFAASNTLKDILMVENQIPCIVLLELLRQENPTDNDVGTTLLNVMAKGTCGLFKMYSEDRTALLELSWLTSGNQEFHHLLGFVHNVMVNRPSGQANLGNQGEHRICIEKCIGRCLQMLPHKNKALNHDFASISPAIELKNAGIKFRPCNGGINQIKFDPYSSTIYLPLLSITYDTEVLFHNLIALEMCTPSEDSYVSSYVNLMDDLIGSQRDVAFLRSMGILTNLLCSDEEVADLFDGLFKRITVRMPNMFDELRRDVDANYTSRIAIYQNRIRVCLAELWQDHFSSPWKAIALAVGFAIVCLTLIQTIYAVKK